MHEESSTTPGEASIASAFKEAAAEYRARHATCFYCRQPIGDAPYFSINRGREYCHKSCAERD